MKAVYLVQHTHIINDDEEDVKMIGIYSSFYLAQAAVERMRLQLGFCDAPDGFLIDSCKLNQDSWLGGYITVYPGDLA